MMVLGEIRLLGFQFMAYYYALGYYLHKCPKLLQVNKMALVILIALWSCMAFFWKMHELPPFLNQIPLPSAMLQYAYRFITGLVAVYALICLAPKILDYDLSCNKLFVKLGQISLGIYVVHLLLIPFITQIIGQWNVSSFLTIITTFVIARVLSWIIVSLLNKWRWTSRLLLGKI